MLAGQLPGHRQNREQRQRFYLWALVILKGCTKMALTPLQAASNLALQASDARESLPQLLCVALHATNLGQLLEDLPFFSGRKTLLERSLLLTDALGSRGEPWRCHVQQNVGTIHPVDMRHHRVKAVRRHILKTDILLDTLMKHLHAPPQTIPGDNLAWRGP